MGHGCGLADINVDDLYEQIHISREGKGSPLREWHIIRREEVGRQSEYQQEMIIKLSLTDRMLPGRFEVG